jgi:hypothetical protein
LSISRASHHHHLPGLCDHRVDLRRKRSIWLAEDRERTSLDQGIMRFCMMTMVWYPIRTPEFLLTSFCCSCCTFLFLVLFASLFPLVVAVVRLCRKSFRCFSVAFSLGFHFSLITFVECATTVSALMPNPMASHMDRASVGRMLRKRKSRNENRSTCPRLGSSFDPVAVLWFGSVELVVVVPDRCRLQVPRP